jgi:hypothetical protein
MLRIKNFKNFNESLEVQVPQMPYMKSLFITPMKDPDLAKGDVEGDEITPKVPQFDPVKTIAIMLEDGDLVNRAAQMFPDTNLPKALENPEMLGPVEMEKLQFVYNEIILKDYVLRQKYDLLPEIDENKCPVCEEQASSWCKCSHNVKHTNELMHVGHGKNCPNGHRWSYQTEDEKLLIMDEAILLPGQFKIKRADAIEIAKTIIEGLGFKYVNPDDVTTSYGFVKNVGIPVGSIRRKRPEVGDVDIIITAPIDMIALRKMPWAKSVSGGDKQVNFTYDTPKVTRKINLFSFMDPNSFGGALLHTTGSHQYNVRLRFVALQRGYEKLSQHGLFLRGKLVAGPTEASIQKEMNVTVREPNQREK